jgi:hypothetical protein
MLTWGDRAPGFSPAGCCVRIANRPVWEFVVAGKNSHSPHHASKQYFPCGTLHTSGSDPMEGSQCALAGSGTIASTGGCSALLKPDCWDPSPISTVDLLVPRLYTHVGHRTCYALARVRKIFLALIITPGGTSSTSQPFDSNDDFGFSPDMDHQAENIQITIKFRFHCFITFVRFV